MKKWETPQIILVVANSDAFNMSGNGNDEFDNEGYDLLW